MQGAAGENVSPEELEDKLSTIPYIKESLVYVLTYTNVASRFDEHTQDFNDILGYFKFK